MAEEIFDSPDPWVAEHIRRFLRTNGVSADTIRLDIDDKIETRKPASGSRARSVNCGSSGSTAA